MKEFLSALSEVSKSSYSFVAYILLIVAWVVIGLRVKRNGQLLKNLEKLPEKDRLKALELEMGTPRLTKGITPEQWLKARNQKYLFLGFAFLLILILIIVVLSFNSFSKNKKVDLTVSLFTETVTTSEPINKEKEAVKKALLELYGKMPEGDLIYPSYDFTKAFVGLITEPKFKTLNIAYEYSSDHDDVKIFPTFPYLDTVKKGGTLVGFRYFRMPFKCKLPIIAVKIVNNTDETVFFKEALFKINKSELDKEPLPIFYEDFNQVGGLSLVNDGWGKMLNARLSFKLIRPQDDLSVTEYDKLTKTVNLNVVNADTIINILPFIQGTGMMNERYVCVMGNLSYKTEDAVDRMVHFKSRVGLQPPPKNAPVPPTGFYDLFLQAGKQNYTITRSLSQSIKSGDSDQFLFYVGSNMSSNYDITLSLSTLNGIKFPDKKISMQLIIPKTIIKHLSEKVRSGESEL